MAGFSNSIYSPNKSGRLGASVFSKNKFGVYEKMFIVPSNPRTDEQINRRSQFAALSRLWGTLTDGQRTAWDNIAQDYPLTKKGESYILSGFLFFIRLNSNLQLINQAVILDPVMLTAPETFTMFEVTVILTPGSEDIKADIAPLIDADTVVQLYATRILKPGRKAKDSDFRHIGNLDSTFVSGSSIQSLYLAKFGIMPTVGQKISFRIKATNKADGCTGLPIASTAIGTI